MPNPTVLVTGGAGYIGSHACKALAAKGFTPVVFDNLCSGNAEAVKWGPLEVGDIRDHTHLDEVMAQYHPVAVMHFAALIRVNESVNDPAKYYENNLLGSYRLLEAARAHKIGAMVFSSTAAVYGNPETTPIAEDHPLRPINPYGQTKLAMENMIRDYSQAYGFKHAILRYFNAAGADAEQELGTAYQTDSHIVPLLMQVAAGQRPQIQIYGTDYETEDGTAIRDYLHITDLANAHVLALEHILAKQTNLTLNLGTNQGCTVKGVLEAVRRVTGQRVPAEECPRRAGDPPALVADASRARQLLGWAPEHSDMENIIATAWAWQQKQNRWGRTGAFGRQLQESAA